MFFVIYLVSQQIAMRKWVFLAQRNNETKALTLVNPSEAYA